MKSVSMTLHAVNSAAAKYPLRPGLFFALFTLIWTAPVCAVVGRELPLYAIAPLLGLGSLGLWATWREAVAARKLFYLAHPFENRCEKAELRRVFRMVKAAEKAAEAA